MKRFQRITTGAGMHPRSERFTSRMHRAAPDANATLDAITFDPVPVAGVAGANDSRWFKAVDDSSKAENNSRS